MKPSWRNLAIAAGAACIVVGISMVVWNAYDEAIVRSWPQVPGRVEARNIGYDVHVRPTQRLYFYYPEVTYTYQVSGRSFRSTSVYAERRPSSRSRQDIEALIAPYRVGAYVRVYYDPADPQHSALIPQIPSGEYYSLILAGLFVIGLTHLTTRPLARRPFRPQAPSGPT